MNMNYTRETRKPTIQPDGKDTRYMCKNEQIRALLGIDDLEELLHSISAAPEQAFHGMGRDARPEAGGDGVWYLPVAITSRSLLNDLERMLAVFDRAVISAKDWQELEEGFFDLLFVKFKLYCIQMRQLGRTGEVQSTKRQLMDIFNNKITALQSRR